MQRRAGARGTARLDTSVTLDDVAQAAGVSTATVSRVINDVPRVASATRERVLEAVERLRYTPNFAGRSLATRRTYTLGLIITDITNPFYPAVVRGVESAAADLGLSVLLYDTAEDSQREAQAVRLLCERQVDGVVICSSRLGQAQLEHLAQGTTPLVFINSHPAPQSVGSVATAHEVGMGEALDHLARFGHRRVAYLGGPPASQVQQQRLRSFRARGSALALALAEASALPTVEGGAEGALRLLRDAGPGTRPTALVTYNDLMAAGALLAARACGIGVPGELSVVGHDDIPMAALLAPALTTVRQPMQELGARAVGLLAAHLYGQVPPEPTVLTLPPELIVRASTAAPREDCTGW